MVTAITVKEKIQGLIDKSNNTTGNSDTTLTDAVDTLVGGYGVDSAPVTEPITITENGVYPVPRGGDLVEGETYTFKKDLSGIDSADFMKTQVGSGPLDGQQYGIASFGGAMFSYLTSEGFDYIYRYGSEIEKNVCPNGVWSLMYVDPSTGGRGEEYIYPLTIRNVDTDEILHNTEGWFHVEFRNPSVGDPVDPPSITIPSPFDASLGYSLEELAVFFEGVGGKALDGWGDITVDVKATPVVEPITITENGVYPVPKGGGLVEGETYTLKNNLNDIDPNDFMKTPATSGDMAGKAYSVALFDATGLMYLTSEGFDYMFNTEVEGVAPAGAWLVVDERELKFYVYFIKHCNNNHEIIDNNVGWLSVFPDTPDGTPVDSVSITISAFDESYGGYSLDELAVFFEVETKSLDGWGDITVDVKATPVVEPITITENGVYPVPKGGSLEFDTDWKFKSVVTPADFEAVISKITPEEENTTDGITEKWYPGFLVNDNVDSFTIFTVSDGNETVYGLHVEVLIDGTYQEYPQYGCIAHVTSEALVQFAAENFEITKEGWQGTDMDILPPTLPVVPESSGIDNKLVAPLFDVPGGKALDGWGDITVNVVSNSQKTLQYGKFAKFKDNITDEMFEEYVAQATPAAHDAFLGDIYLLCLDESRYPWLIGNNPDMGGWVIMDPSGVRMYGTGYIYNEETDTDVEFRGWWERLSTSSDPVNYPVCAVPSEKPAVEQFNVWPDETSSILIELTKEKISATPEVSAIFFEDVDYPLAPPNSFVVGNILYIACPMGDLVEEYVLQEVNDGRVWATIPKTDDYMEVNLIQYNIEETPGWNVGYLRVGAKIRTQWSANVRYDDVIET